MDDLAQMKYLEMVIKESLRLYTIVPAMHRLPEEDITIKVCTPKQASYLSRMQSSRVGKWKTCTQTGRLS